MRIRGSIYRDINFKRGLSFCLFTCLYVWMNANTLVNTSMFDELLLSNYVPFFRLLRIFLSLIGFFCWVDIFVLIYDFWLIRDSFLRSNWLLNLFPTVRLGFLTIIWHIHFMIFEANKRSVFVVLVRFLAFWIELFVTFLLYIKRKLFLVLVFVLGRWRHQDIFEP
jgi:hypothetical protein